MLALLPLSQARAAEQECSGTVTEPGVMQIECRPGYATDHDLLKIISTQEFNRQQHWTSQIDMTNATWIFDAEADTLANLIIQFEQQGDEVRAKIFDDQDNDGRVAYRQDQREVLVTEHSRQPTLVVTAKHSWVRPDGKPNFNFDITADGPVEGMIDADVIYLDQLKTDGKPDLTIHVRDPNHDGRPNYEWRQAYPPLAEEDGFYHTSVMVNTADDEPPIQQKLFWPLLGMGAQSFTKGNYADFSEAPINIDWRRSKINYLVETVASRNRPHNFFVYSIRRITEGTLNHVNFESPFAFYQLSPHASNFPDLALRVAYYPAGDVAAHLPVQQVDFSWRQTSQNLYHLPNWDYRLGLTGHNEHQGIIALPDFSMRLTPYQQLPAWVATNQWDYASFIARESGEYLSSEGIYEWATLEGVVVDMYNQQDYVDISKESHRLQEDYVYGADKKVPGRYYQQIRQGLRGEFRSDTGIPKLYFSPIDHKLHIMGADHGVWQIDEHSTLRSANLDQDSYLDQWTYTATTTDTTMLTTTRQLNVAPSHLLYSDQAGITIREAHPQPSLFETLPPTNQAEWEALGAQLTANQRTHPPDDLQALLRQFAGPEMQISGAALSDYRPVGKSGFRFVLTLRPGFTAQGMPLLPVQTMQPGDYAVIYDGSFQVLPLTPPAPASIVHTSALNQLEPSAIQFTLGNNGLQDLPASTLELWAAPPDAEAEIIVTDTVTLLAQQPLTTTLQWTPPSPGIWTITPKLRLSGERVITLQPAEISVAPAQTISAGMLIAASASYKTFPLILAIVGTFALLAAYVWRQQWRSFVMEQADDSA
jgi:hypothetical protein